MELTIYWTQFAEDKLIDVFEYYKFKASIKVARSLVGGIVETTITLSKNPYAIQRETSLIRENYDFRYLLFKHYKIIYWIDELNGLITISNVFDSRQNPITIYETKK